MKLRSLLPLLFLLAACNASTGNNAGNNTAGWMPPPTGTVVAADSMNYEDGINNFYFAVKLSVSGDNELAKGDYGFIYNITTHCGPGELTGSINMPPGGKSLKPLLRKSASEKYTYLIGFIAGPDLGGDGKTFQELYSVTGSPQKVEIRPLKNYRFR